ncbi:tetratricopeptide repeat domain protein [Stigmatella aurantiaca DW4/3-1]|nr:tetratricopeptide repeat domain protein [Stigmatella aurantiaca DW4/3-1]
MAWTQEETGVPAPSEAASAQALAVYEQGKRLYDAKDYAGALERFDQAAALEPGKARWQYNRGLALRKLNRFEEARTALLQSRTLDPAYKQAEIDDKLREMGFSDEPVQETGRASSPKGFQALGPLLCGVGPFVGAMAVLYWMFRRSASRKRRDPARSSRPPSSSPVPRPEELRLLNTRLEQLSSSLVQVEHALRLEEDADLRALLNQATLAEQRSRDALDRARQGQLPLDAAAGQLRAAQDSAEAALKRAQSLFGERAFQPEGARVGCYFCARPLANPAFRMLVPLKRGADVTKVLACPPCANMASAGQPPPVKVRQLRNGQTQHWSELDGYDPYLHRHKPYPEMGTVPSWEYAPQRSLGEVAAMAAGGALATGLAAYGMSKLLDLDTASEAAAAQAATQASAARASERREERDWRDHS